MNPFDLTGPQFLLFYFLLSLVTVTLIGRLRRIADEMRAAPATMGGEIKGRLVRLRTGGESDMSSIAADPYMVAYLRGGKNEALRVAALSLVDRVILQHDGEDLIVSGNVTPAHVRRPIEKALIRHFAVRNTAQSIFTDKALEEACSVYETTLAKAGLMPDSDQKAKRRSLFLSGAALLASVSLIKAIIAISRGRFNLIFLLIMTIIAIIVLAAVVFPKQTPAGRELLRDLRTLFGSLRERASSIRPGGGSNELALLAAVYGMSAVSAIHFPWAKKLFPKADSSGGGSCGSSCGSGCGGGCGGGGCGGCG